jgi:hypothetical protein
LHERRTFRRRAASRRRRRSDEGTDVVENAKYGAGDVKRFHSKLDVAVEAALT